MYTVTLTEQSPDDKDAVHRIRAMTLENLQRKVREYLTNTATKSYRDNVVCTFDEARWADGTSFTVNNDESRGYIDTWTLTTQPLTPRRSR